MGQFEMMVNYLENRDDNFLDTVLYSDEELENISLALVESVLLNGYKISDKRVYKTTLKKVTERVNA